MSDATKKIRRRDLHLRDPDEFITLTGRAVDWARANQRLVTAAGGAVLAVVLLAGAWSWIRQARQARAARQFYAASELFRREQWDAAEKDFAEIAGSLGRTPYGRLAGAYAGRAALRAGRSADAATYLEDYLRDPAPDVAVEQLARISLAAALEAQGNVEGARSSLERALALAGPARGEATLELARVEEAAGAKEKALELYQRYLSDQPDGVARDLARARLVALGGTPPAEPSRLPMAPPILTTTAP